MKLLKNGKPFDVPLCRSVCKRFSIPIEGSPSREHILIGPSLCVPGPMQPAVCAPDDVELSASSSDALATDRCLLPTIPESEFLRICCSLVSMVSIIIPRGPNVIYSSKVCVFVSSLAITILEKNVHILEEALGITHWNYSNTWNSLCI